MNARCDHPGSIDNINMEEARGFMVDHAVAVMREIDKTNVRFRLTDVNLDWGFICEGTEEEHDGTRHLLMLYVMHGSLFLYRIQFTYDYFEPELGDDTAPFRVTNVTAHRRLLEDRSGCIDVDGLEEYFQTLHPRQRKILLLSKANPRLNEDILIALKEMLGN